MSHAPCPVRLGEKKKLTAEIREDIPRKDVCYVDERALLCFVCFSRSVTLLLLVFVALSGRFSGIAGPFTRGDGEDACVLFVSCFVSFLLG